MTTPARTPPGLSSADAERRREADDILRRVREETDPQTGTIAHAAARGVGRHFWGSDADPQDRAAVWGTRVGRLGGLAAFLVLAVLLVLQMS